MLFEQLYRQHDQIIKIYSVVCSEVAVVLLVEACGGMVSRIAGNAHCLFRENKIIFPAGDAILNLFLQCIIATLPAQQFTDQGRTILSIENGEARFVTQVFEFAANDIESQVMEGRYSQSPALFSLKQFANAFLHLPCSLVGEGDRSNMACGDAAFTNQVGNLMGDNACFTASGTGQYQQGAVDMTNSLTLSRV